MNSSDMEVESQERLPPHDLDAEKSLLAALLLCDSDPEVRAEVSARINSGMFFQPDHAIIFDAVLRMWTSASRVDAVTLAAELRKHGLLEDVGGASYLAEILNCVPSWRHWGSYLAVVRDVWVRRRMTEVAMYLNDSAHEPAHLSPDDHASSAVRMLTDAMQSGRGASQYVALGDLAAKTYESLEASVDAEIVYTGLADLDASVGGIYLGEMVVLAARPSMGKSTLARQIVFQVAAGGVPAALISAEETLPKIGRNLLAANAGVENNRLRRRTLVDAEWKALAGSMAAMADIPCYVASAQRLSDVRSAAMLLAAKEKCKLIIIDHMHRIVGVPGRTPYERGTAVSGELCALGRACNVALIAVAQLNRGTEYRAERQPTMKDLRDSGAIEQDADGILFLHREDYYHLDDSNWQPTNVAELIVAKWRDGRRGQVIQLRSNLRYQRFEPHIPEEIANDAG